MLKLLAIFFIILLIGFGPQSPMKLMYLMNKNLPRFGFEFEKKWEDFIQKQPPEVFYKKTILKNFAKLTGKHLCWSFFLSKETPTQGYSCALFETFRRIFL